MRAIRAFVMGVALLLAACGRQTSATPATTPTAADPTANPSTVSPSPRPTTPPGWSTYSDPQFGFRIAYPPGFTFIKEGKADPAAGWLIEYRGVDRTYLGSEPPGQVEMGIYVMDSDTMANWVTRHTGTPSATSHTAYWQRTYNIQAVEAAGRSGLAFDYDLDGFTSTPHAAVFLQDSTRVVRLDWWSTSAAYAASIQAIAKQMLDSFDG